MRYLFVTYMLVFSMLAVNAETTEQHEDIIVTARPVSSQGLEHITQPVKVLTGEELEQKQRNTIGETLANELGVSSSDFGQGSSRPIIRGLGGPRLNVLQDALSSMDVSSISVDHAVSVNPIAAEQIEIVRGPATLLYGNGSSAGLVNIVTNRIPDSVTDFSAKLNTQYLSALEAATAAFLVEGSPHQNLAFHIDGSHFESEDYEAADFTVLNSEIDTQDINLGGSFIGDQGYIGFSYGRYQSEYGIPFNPEEPDELVFIDLKQDRFDLAGEWKEPVNGFSLFKIRAGYNDYTHTEFEGPGEPGTIFTNEEWETRFEAAHDPIGPWTGAIGVQYRDRDFVSDGEEAFVPPSELYSIGVFLFEEMDWNEWHFEVGGRYEHQSTEALPETGFVEVDHDTYSVSLGAHWDFRDDYHLAANISRSQRAPSIEELFAGGPHLATETFEVGDVSLDEETSNNIDLSLANTDGNVTWKVNLFANYIEDYIFQQFQDVNGDGEADEVDDEGVLGAGDLLSVRFVQSDAIFYGLEAEAEFAVYSGPFGDAALRLFGDVVEAELTNGDDIPRITPARVGLGIEWTRQQWFANLDLIHTLEQNNAAELESETDGFLMLNTLISYDIATYGSVFFRMTNLLDEDARRHTSFIKDRAPLPGRSFDVGVRLRF